MRAEPTTEKLPCTIRNTTKVCFLSGVAESTEPLPCILNLTVEQKQNPQEEGGRSKARRKKERGTRSTSNYNWVAGWRRPDGNGPNGRATANAIACRTPSRQTHKVKRSGPRLCFERRAGGAAPERRRRNAPPKAERGPKLRRRTRARTRHRSPGSSAKPCQRRYPLRPRPKLARTKSPPDDVRASLPNISSGHGESQ